jgi:DNA (cytosine-5)-methyltransferase 1
MSRDRESGATRPKLLDLFCCEGGAAAGYTDAGFDVFGVDLFKHLNERGQRVGFSQDRYPYPSLQMDALECMSRLISHQALTFSDGQTLTLDDFSAIHASPPGQHASAGTRAMRAHGDDRHPTLIEPVREHLQLTGLPYAIENVSGAALANPLTLCWSMFFDPFMDGVRNEDGVLLRMERHRLFESNILLTAPAGCVHDTRVQVAGSYGAAQRTIEGAKKRGGGYVPSKEIQARLLGTPWMTEAGMHQCIPPAYTEWVGEQLLDYVKTQEEVGHVGGCHSESRAS